MKSAIFSVMLAVALLFGMQTTVLADFGITIVGVNGTTYGPVTILDNQMGDTNPAPLAMTVSSGVAGVPLIPGIVASVNTVLTNIPGGPTFSLLDVTWSLSSVTPNPPPADIGGSIQVTASAQGFTFPSTDTPATLKSVISGNGTGDFSVTGQQWANLANTFEGLGAITPGPQGPFTTDGFSNSASVNFNAITPYSITDRLTMTVGAESITTGDLKSTITGKVPEPISLILLGSGLAAAGLYRRLRKSKKA